MHGHRLGPIGHAELGVDARDLVAHRLFAAAEALADLSVAAADGHPAEHGMFGSGERGVVTRVGYERCSSFLRQAQDGRKRRLSPNGLPVIRWVGIDGCRVAHGVQRSLKLSFAACRIGLSR